MRRSRPAFTLIEVLVAMVLLSVAILGSVELIARITFSTEQNREMSLAQDAARTALDAVVDLAREDIDKVVPSYNADPTDDPDGPGTAPGPYFGVPDLNATGMALFPGLILSNGLVLSEGGDADAAASVGSISMDVSNPNLVQVSVTVSWKGIKGLQDYTLQTKLARLTEAAP